MENKNKTAVGYCRISSESQIDNTSIESQIDKITGYCNTYDIKLLKIFTDEAQSAKTTKNREAYNEMINYIKTNKVDSIIVYKADRIHRRLKNLLIMIEDILTPLNTSFVSITEKFDTTTSQGMLFLQMIGSFGEFERKVINERTKGGRIKKGSKEMYAGGRVPYGYKLVNNDYLKLRIDEASIVNKIFKLRTEGKSIQKIADVLNSEDIKSRQGEKWCKSSINYILNNEIYIGKYTYDGIKEQNNIFFKVDKAISKQLWNKVHSPYI